MTAAHEPVAPLAVLHVPHASVHVPPDVRAAIGLSHAELDLELLRMTDRYTDELFDLPPAVAVSVRYDVSRLVVDPERFADDADEPMAGRGMGAVYTRTSQGAALRAPVTPAERARLMARYYRPHHERLTRAVEAVLAARGSCLVLDCHSFASAPLPYEPDQAPERPDICLGTDSFHSPPSLIAGARSAFEAAGFTVTLDRPFAGALVPMAHYRRDARVTALMVEVNRGLYMDERSGERLAAFGDVRARVQAAVRRVIASAGAVAS